MNKFVLGDGEKIVIHGFAIAYQYAVEGKGYFRGVIGGPYTIQANKLPEELQEQVVKIILSDIREREEDQ